jgi:Domain of unknown function (DUF4282)
MVDFREMFQWSRFITPIAAPLFFWAATFAAAVVGLFGFTAGVILAPDYPVVAIIVVVFSIAMACLGIISARLIAEFVLISFRTNDHIHAIRILAQPATPEPRANREEGPTPIIPHAA